MNGATIDRGGDGPSPDLPPGISLAEAEAYAARQERIASARGKALPGPLREAFAGEPRRIRIATSSETSSETWIPLQPVTAGTEAILTRIDSPLLPTFGLMWANRALPHDEIRKLLEEKIKPAPESFVETVFCFCKPARELRLLLDKGRQVFREAAFDLLGDKMHPLDLAAAQRVVSEHYSLSFATIIEHQAAAAAGDGEGNFTVPPSKSSRTGTASAGG